MANGKDGECYVRLLKFMEGEILQKLPVVESFWKEIGGVIGRCHDLMEAKESSRRFPFLSNLQVRI